MKISFSIQAWEEQSQDKKTLKKINGLIKDIERNSALNGIGKPEKLTNNLSRLYSRRINDKVSIDPFYSKENIAALQNSIDEVKDGKVIMKTIEELEAME